MFLFITDMPTMSPATPTTDGGSSAAGSVPKWVYALAIGVPVAAALAYILFGPSTDSDVQSKKAKKSKPKADAVEAAEPKDPVEQDEKTVEVEDCPEDVPTDPLAKALAAKNKGKVLCIRNELFRIRLGILEIRIWILPMLFKHILRKPCNQSKEESTNYPTFSTLQYRLQVQSRIHRHKV